MQTYAKTVFKANE